MPFKNWKDQQRFFEYIENSTTLYKIDFLGYPWYHTAKEALNNQVSGSTPVSFSPEVQIAREKDFLSKVALLNQNYDYAFIFKGKMRRRDEDQCENLIFLEILNFLQDEGKRFIILEEPSGQPYDAKYLHSRFAPFTLPYECLDRVCSDWLNPISEKGIKCYQGIVTELFRKERHSAEFSAWIEALREVYFNLSGLVRQIMLRRHLFQKMGVKALFGGMGTHLTAGLTNKFSAVEVWHGLPGMWMLHPPPPQPLLQEYHRRHFNLNRLFALVLSPTQELFQGEQICLEENRYNYGVPEIRQYQFSLQRIQSLRQKLNLQDDKTILLITAGRIDYPALDNLLFKIREKFPDAKLLLRPHPGYENPDRYSSMSDDYIKLVPDENKYDLINLARVVISLPSSMVMESLHFTDNILVYPSLDYSSPEELELLRKRYPFAQIITLDNTDKFLSALETMLAQPSGKNPPSHPSDYKSNLKRLFSTIEARFSSPETEDNGYDVVYCINKRGEEAFSMGDLLSAEKCFLQALNLNPNYIYAFNNLGVLYGNLKQPQKAFEYLQTAVDIDPSNVIVTLNFLDLCLTLNSKLNNRYSISSKVPDER